MANDVKFEGKERRMPQIEACLAEYGIASLSGKTLRERAEAMASIAHPDFREELMKYAQENFK